METLQKWLQESLSKSFGAMQTTQPNAEDENTEKGIIRMFKDQITRASSQFEAQQNSREQRMREIVQQLTELEAVGGAHEIDRFFQHLNDEHVKKLSSGSIVPSAAVKRSLIRQLQLIAV